MKKRLHASETDKGHSLLMTGYYNPPGKNALRGFQSILQQGLSLKIRHQFIASKAPAHTGSHDNASQPPERLIQVQKKDIVAMAKFLQERQGLLSDYGKEALAGH